MTSTPGALVHIYIPQMRTPCGRGLYRQGLTRLSWGLPSASALLPSFVPLLYHTLRGLSRGFSNFFEKSFRLALSHSYQCLGVCGLLPSPLDTLIVSQLGRFVKGFFTFFFEPSKVSQWLRPPDLPASAGSDFGGTPCTPLPLTPIAYHRPHQKSIGNIAQIREK